MHYGRAADVVQVANRSFLLVPDGCIIYLEKVEKEAELLKK